MLCSMQADALSTDSVAIPARNSFVTNVSPAHLLTTYSKQLGRNVPMGPCQGGAGAYFAFTSSLSKSLQAYSSAMPGTTIGMLLFHTVIIRAHFVSFARAAPVARNSAAMLVKNSFFIVSFPAHSVPGCYSLLHSQQLK